MGREKERRKSEAEIELPQGIPKCHEDSSEQWDPPFVDVPLHTKAQTSSVQQVLVFQVMITMVLPASIEVFARSLSHLVHLIYRLHFQISFYMG